MTTVDVSLTELLEAGCHFGHQARRWHPKMNQYLYAKKEGLHIFDLVKTKEGLEESAEFLKSQMEQGKRIVIVATKRQAQTIVRDVASRLGVAFMTERWLGGTLTNYQQIRVSINKLERLKKRRDSQAFKELTKREQLLQEREINKLEKFLKGLAVYEQAPEVMLVIDTRREKVAVAEANKIGIPVVALVDSNSDPTGVDYVIPANDDAVKSIQVIMKKLVDAMAQGKANYEAKKQEEEVKKKEAADAKAKKKSEK